MLQYKCLSAMSAHMNFQSGGLASVLMRNIIAVCQKVHMYS